MRYSSILLSAAAFLTVTQAIPAEAPWEETLAEEVSKVTEEPVADAPTSDHLEENFQQHDTSGTSTVGTPVMATPETSAVGVPQIATPLPTYTPTTLVTSAYAAITSCTTFHMEADPYNAVTSCTTYHKENNGGNQGGPTTTPPTSTRTSTTSNYGAITSCTTFHMEADPYKPITSCTTYHNENNAIQPKPATPTTTTAPPSTGATAREFCTSLYGNFTWCYSAADTKPDPSKFPSCNDAGCVLPATYATQAYKAVNVQSSQAKDYAPWATGPQWTDKVYAAKANIIVGTLFLTEWLYNDYPQYRVQARIFNETASQFQGQQFYKINIDDANVSPKLAEINIRSLPTYVFYRGGAEIGRLEGFQPKKALEDKMKSFK